MSLQPPPATPIPFWKRGIGYVAVGVFIAFYIFITLWDFVVWAIYGTAFLHSPLYRTWERHIAGLAGSGYIFFIGVDGGGTLLKEKRYGRFILAFIVFIFAGIPVATLLLALHKAIILRGWVVLSRPRFWQFSGLMLIAIVCKARVWINFLRLLRPHQPHQETHHIVIETQ